MFSRPHYIALSLVFLLAFILLNLPSHTAARMKLALSGLFLPLLGLTSSAQAAADTAANSLLPRKILASEVDRLRLENSQLRAQSMQMAGLLMENSQLRSNVGWQRQFPWKAKLAHVTLRDPANWWRTIQIDLGSKDGIRTNLAVLSSEGLVGRVDQVNTSSSRVVLLGDANCKVSAMIEKTKDSGVLLASDSTLFDPSFLDLAYLSRAIPVEPGLRVTTSGYGGIFPRGILIGHVVDVRNVGYGLYQEARVKLSANLKIVDEVLVILN